MFNMEKSTNQKTPPSIGIITDFYNNINHGGALQAYALCQAIHAMGYDCEQLSYSHTIPKDKYRNIQQLIIGTYKKITLMFTNAKKYHTLGDFFKTLARFAFVTCFGHPFRLLKHKLIINKRREQLCNNFDNFNMCNVKSSPEYTSLTINNAADKYDIFIAGSDQIWNPFGNRKAYYLDFVPDNKPKIAYAASTAVSSITNAQYHKMQPLVSRINYISVREKNAVNMLKDMTSQKIEWVVDPTLLLTVDEWNKVAKKRVIKEPYVLAYLLGDNKKNRNCVKHFARSHRLPLVTLPFIGTRKLWQLWFGDMHCYGGPDTFVSLVRDAEYVITDSFHGVVFCTLFHKRFVVLKRHTDTDKTSMSERLYSIFEITGMGGQLVSPDEGDVVKKIEEICYDGVDERINEWKKKSLSWLKNALENSMESQSH